MNNEKLITPRKAAELLCVTTDCLRKWEMAQKLQAIKTMGGHRRYRLCDIESLKNNHNFTNNQ